MRGFVEESPAVKAARSLREAARRFAGFYLVHGFGGDDVEASTRVLEEAAVAYAITQRPPPRKRAERKKRRA